MENKKKIVMVALSVLVCIMAVGYAVLAQQLNINGTASIDSTWKVEITNIQEQEVVGKATSKVTPSYTSTIANFSVSLTQLGDSITYDVEISNLGTLDAKVDSININVDENDAIKYTTTGITNGDKLASGEKTTLTIKVEYDSSVTSQPSVTTNDIIVTVNYVQDLGEDGSITYQTYSIGDVVTFAGSNWYVIKNSTSDEDYVTLLKETILTNAELGEYAATSTSDTMAYYWSDTCHRTETYGYTGEVNTGCSEHNDYEGSKVKEFLESVYINTLDSGNLKEVEGYKIRLITKEEITNDLGWVTLEGTGIMDIDKSLTPVWVYKNFGESEDTNNIVTSYWTMTPSKDISGNFLTFAVGYDRILNQTMTYAPIGVRPVINLLKSSI